jgi:hypothetical protein
VQAPEAVIAELGEARGDDHVRAPLHDRRHVSKTWISASGSCARNSRTTCAMVGASL